VFLFVAHLRLLQFPIFSYRRDSLLVHLLVALLFFFFFFLFSFCQLLSFPSLLSVGEVTGIFSSCLIATVAQDPSFFLFFFVLVSHLCFVFCIDEVFLIFASFFCEACLGLFFSPPSPPSSSFSSGFVWLRNGHSLSLRLSLVLSFVFSPAFLLLSTPPFLFFVVFFIRGPQGLFLLPPAAVVSSAADSYCLSIGAAGD
jgi:hypothetical protein